MQTVRNRLFLAKEESVYGQDPTPTPASNAKEVKNLKVNYSADLLQRDNIRGNISPVSPVVGKRFVEVTFQMELKSGGTKGTAGALGDLLEACSMAETVSAGSSVVYAPNSSSQKSITFYIYNMDTGSAVLHKITGAVGTFVLKGEAGNYATLDFTFRGLYNAPTDATTPVAGTFEATLPPIVESCAFSLGSADDLIVQSVSLDIANDIAERDDISTANAIASFFVVSRKPKGSFNPEAVLVGDFDVYTDWIASTQRALSMVVGSVSGNKITITAPKVTVDSLADGDRNGVLTNEMPFSLGQNVGNDEISLKFE